MAYAQLLKVGKGGRRDKIAIESGYGQVHYMHVCKYHSEFDYRINSCKNIVLLGFILLY
jgi:hypothetical protein